MARRAVTWKQLRDPLYALLGAAIIVTQILQHQWNPLACGVALALFGLPGVIALNEWRGGSDSTHGSSDSSPSDGPASSPSGHSGGSRRDEPA